VCKRINSHCKDESFIARRIPEDWPRCVVPIETLQDSQFVGTGFLMNYYTIPCLVINRHVIEGEEELQYRLNLPDQRIDRIKINQEEGYENYFNRVCHPNEDIVLAALLVPARAYTRAPHKHAPSCSYIKKQKTRNLASHGEHKNLKPL